MESIKIERGDYRVPSDFLCCDNLSERNREVWQRCVPALSASFSCPLSFLKVASFPSRPIPCRRWAPCRRMMAFELVLVVGTFGPRPRMMTARETSSPSTTGLRLVWVWVWGMTAAAAGIGATSGDAGMTGMVGMMAGVGNVECGDDWDPAGYRRSGSASQAGRQAGRGGSKR